MADSLEYMKKYLKQTIRFTLGYLPCWLRHEIVRRSISLPETLPDHLIFKIAETTNELESSFKLVYDVYLEMGYCAKNHNNLRATVYHALPSTTTLIALDHGEVVGTLTIVRDNRLGLPLDKVFNVKNLRQQSNRLAEITSLVIHKKYRREKGGQILFPLLRLMYEYSTSYFGVNHLLVTIHPKNIDFYTSLLLFKIVPETKIENYLGAPAICLELDLRQAFFNYKKIYANRNQLTNLFSFFIERKFDQILLPQRTFHTINDPIVHTKYFQDFFIKKMQIPITRTERRIVESYLQKQELRIFHCRFEVNTDAKYKDGTMTIKNVSRTGFLAMLDDQFKNNEPFQVLIEVAPQIYSELTAALVWQATDQRAGFEIISSDKNWINFIDFLNQDQFGKVA